MTRIPKDELEIYFEYGVDIKNRRIFLTSDIDSESIGAVLKALYMLDSQNKDHDIIELFIGSYGGEEYDMFALHDVTRTLESPISTFALGKCMSAAPLLVACGEKGKRCATENTFFMVHQSWTDIDAKRIDAIGIDISHYKDMASRWYKLMERYTKKPLEFWQRKCEEVGDFYFSSQEALEWGIIDFIWDEKDGE